MAPPTNDNNNQQGLRRSTRSNLGKPGPSLINGYLTGDAAARPALRPKRRVGEVQLSMTKTTMGMKWLLLRLPNLEKTVSSWTVSM